MIDTITHVISLDHPGLEPYRTLKRPAEHRKRGIFIVEGKTVVDRFFESSLTALSILLAPEWFEQYEKRLEKRPEKMQVFVADKKLLHTIVGFECHQGLMALANVPSGSTIDEALKISPVPRIFVAVDHLVSAENTGVLIRNCAACGVQVLIVGETSSDPYLRRSVRNSMGTVFRLPVVYAEKLTDTLRDLRSRFGFSIFAAHPRPSSTPLPDADFSFNSCIVFGNEGDGISDAVLAECDKAVAIPMAPGVDSFNVACASAVVLYEVMRQRDSR